MPTSPHPFRQGLNMFVMTRKQRAVNASLKLARVAFPKRLRSDTVTFTKTIGLMALSKEISHRRSN